MEVIWELGNEQRLKYFEDACQKMPGLPSVMPMVNLVRSQKRRDIGKNRKSLKSTLSDHDQNVRNIEVKDHSGEILDEHVQ